jgi:hypothetical protein
MTGFRSCVTSEVTSAVSYIIIMSAANFVVGLEKRHGLDTKRSDEVSTTDSC